MEGVGSSSGGVRGEIPSHHSLPPPPEVNTPSTSQPTKRDILIYRKQRGVNLGSLFTLETWLTPSLFQGVRGAQSEMDLLQNLSTFEAKNRLENHWKNFIDEGDWKWMKSQNINTVRLPISYYHFLSGHPDEAIRSWMKDTEYESFIDVYSLAYDQIIKTIETANRYDMGVLIDLHAAPGAQNADGHSGLSNAPVGLWEGSRAKKNQKRTIAILTCLAHDLIRFDNVIGLEVMNEPKNSNRLESWYQETIDSIRKVGGSTLTLPIYLGDGWDTNHYTGFVGQHAKGRPGDGDGFLVVDHHLYRCFTPSDHSISAADHARNIDPDGEQNKTCKWLKQMSDRCGGSIIIGEWSAALNPASMPGGSGNKQARHQWAHAQLRAYTTYCAGHFFWTLKKEGSSDSGWCLYTAIEHGILPQGLLASSNDSKEKRGNEKDIRAQGEKSESQALQQHSHYWDLHAQGKPMEHWRFQQGFRQAWNDAFSFWQQSNGKDSIGFKGQWIKYRTQAHIREKGTSTSVWEYEHGMGQGIDAFEKMLL